MFKQSQKFRIIVSGVSFYATKKTIANGVGDHFSFNNALIKALDELERLSVDGTCGICATYNGFSIQLNKSI